MPPKRKYDADELATIRRRFRSGEAATDIGVALGVSRQRVYQLLRLADPDDRPVYLAQDRERKRQQYWDDPEASRQYQNQWYRNHVVVRREQSISYRRSQNNGTNGGSLGLQV